jgi:hypothetical protein
VVTEQLDVAIMMLELEEAPKHTDREIIPVAKNQKELKTSNYK